MGITGLARWINAPTTGLDLINENIMRNHNGVFRGRWKLSVRSYKSTFGAIHGIDRAPERTLSTLTMNQNVFVQLDDPMAPTRADLAAMASQDPSNPAAQMPDPTHYRSTFLTLTPPGALEQLLNLLRARWNSTRVQQLAIEGYIFSIGNDWIIRAGNVILGGGAVKGMLLEAEYLPVPTMSSQPTDKTSELLSNLLLSVLPNVQDAKTVAVTISDEQWEDVLWDREQEEHAEKPAEISRGDDEIFIFADGDTSTHQKGDWVGVDRDRRSAYLIIGALKSEALI
ncbi:hypothetical protein FA95DRAFT_1632059 [Auriscalpium vulgare]|uniref:Uncharacterized protein n=1 Tax=Auriscalpium vulgare TaxID=40419 RepID=A0ACB8SCH6_9AGAM|nr:hypothetical protein FA95DRAFT_1632059 [Auriscalpium vulgare]